MLMTVIFLLLVLLLVSFLTVRLRKRDQQATRKRHPREPYLERPPVVTQAITRVKNQKNNPLNNINTDDALGLSVEYIKINVMAPKNSPYNGYELLQALLANGLRFGAMNIFHRHETKTGRGSILFSVASVNEPGTFELSKMGSFSCPGLTFFMILKNVPDVMEAFDTLLETTRQLAEDLGGEVWDEALRPLNMDTIAKMRARIKALKEN